jgi:hypothetical protein
MHEAACNNFTGFLLAQQSRCFPAFQKPMLVARRNFCALASNIDSKQHGINADQTPISLWSTGIASLAATWQLHRCQFLWCEID